MSTTGLNAWPGWQPADWPAPQAVRAGHTLRSGGVSRGPWGMATGADGLNLGAACGDDPLSVRANRARLSGFLPDEPVWLDQVHGQRVHRARARDAACTAAVVATDASVTNEPGVVLAVLSADCLPVLLAATDGSAIGAAHAGWRGLAGGVLENTHAALEQLSGGSTEWLAWLGPAIGPSAFEVGDEVLAVFEAADPQAARCFVRADVPGKWFADLFELARQRLRRMGVGAIHGGTCSTVSDPARYYSYRRDRTTGRMASLIWLDRVL